ncbi:MAG: ferritin-like domain-containing protein [Bdellovibrionota bacterium]
MKKPVDIGMNRTGIDSSPLLSREMLSKANLLLSRQTEAEMSDSDLRKECIREADPIGTVPFPGTLKGVAKTSLQKLSGKKPEVFIDKLGERLAFERSGVRLYEALIRKYEVQKLGIGGISLEALQKIKDEELRHFEIVRDAMKSLGADPTAMTPCADVTAVSSMGLVQVLNDPRTTVEQCLQAILTAELVDNDGWDLLVKLAREAGNAEMIQNFERALREEAGHLEQVRSWVNDITLVEAERAA